jgi:hypothetical protein
MAPIHVREQAVTTGVDRSCDPPLPPRFVLRQAWVSPFATYNIVEAPPKLSKNSSNADVVTALKNIAGLRVIGSYRLKLLSARGWVGYPRVRVWNRRDASGGLTHDKGRMVAVANAKGSFKLDEMLDWRYVFACGRQEWTVREAKMSFKRDVISGALNADRITMRLHIFEGHQPKSDEDRVATALVGREVTGDMVVTRVRFIDKRGRPIDGLFAKRVTSVANDWRSGLRSKWYVETTDRGVIPPRVVALIPLIFSWVSRSRSQTGTMTSLVSNAGMAYAFSSL